MTDSTKEISTRRKAQFRDLITTNKSYPLATVTYHGPSPEEATKIIVGVITKQDKDPIVREWSGPDIAEDVQTAREIARFIQEFDIVRVLTSEWVLSCPHQEGVDYPEGEDCPSCPGWY